MSATGKWVGARPKQKITIERIHSICRSHRSNGTARLKTVALVPHKQTNARARAHSMESKSNILCICCAWFQFVLFRISHIISLTHACPLEFRIHFLFALFTFSLCDPLLNWRMVTRAANIKRAHIVRSGCHNVSASTTLTRLSRTKWTTRWCSGNASIISVRFDFVVLRQQLNDELKY